MSGESGEKHEKAGEGDGGVDRGGGRDRDKGKPTKESGVFTFRGSEGLKKHGESKFAPGDGESSRRTTFSYQDKLLSPGLGGFLIQHDEEEDLVKGWKAYFHKMNEKDAVNSSTEDLESDEGEEGLPRTKRAVLKVTEQEYTEWYMPWMNSLIIKVLGAEPPNYIIKDRINRMWKPQDPLKVIPLSNGYYIVSFTRKEDRDYAYQEGPWMIDDHYLLVQRWRPNFNPWKADHQRRVAVWVRIPDIPMEFYNAESIRRIGNMIGKTLKIDRTTSIYDKRGFSRICVEIDLQQPLFPSFYAFGEDRAIIYEGLHLVCFHCGKYGHEKKQCSLLCQEGQNVVTEIMGLENKAARNQGGRNNKDEKRKDTKSDEIAWNQVGDGLKKKESNKGFEKYLKWVPVRNKRKGVMQLRPRDKENKPHVRDKIKIKELARQVSNPIETKNSFATLQEQNSGLEPSKRDQSIMGLSSVSTNEGMLCGPVVMSHKGIGPPTEDMRLDEGMQGTAFSVNMGQAMVLVECDMESEEVSQDPLIKDVSP